MKTEQLETAVKEIKEKEDFLAHLKIGNKLTIVYQGMREFHHVFTLSKKESDTLEEMCLLRIKELKEWIKKTI